MTRFHVIIPARYASTRFPGKVLERIHGKTLVEHVYRAARASGAKSVAIATDDQRVLDAAREFGATALMTAEHPSGSDRIAEAARLLNFGEDEFIVNVQGDEPGVPPQAIAAVAGYLDSGAIQMSTLATPISDLKDIMSPHVVKVVRDHDGCALYFSRAPIPFSRESFAGATPALPADGEYLRHIGIYGYVNRFLQRLTGAPTSTLEQVECLEQLRALYLGGRIRVGLYHDRIPPGVDVPEDLERAALAMGGGALQKRLLFVCMGNICRSPTAQGVAEKLIAQRGLTGRITVDSAGTHAYHVGEAPDPRSIKAARKRGVDLAGQRARGLVAEDFENFDHVLVMDRRNLERVRAVAPDGASARVQLIMEFASLGGIEEVPDPYYGGRHGFEQVLDLLENAISGLLDEVAKDSA